MAEATARAHPNIALIKYWGRSPGSDPTLNLPATGSLSMTMGGLATTTTVRVAPSASKDEVRIDGQPAPAAAYDRVVRHLDRLRAFAKEKPRMQVVSRNNFPQGSGLASSASAFAALTVAANEALGLGLDHRACSVLARQGSGSGARSLYGGWVQWKPGKRSEDSYAEPVAGMDHLNVVDVVALVSKTHKKVGSSEGHNLAGTSPLHEARVAGVPKLLQDSIAALQRRDLAELGRIAELDALAMHAVMMTSQPSLLYWEPKTVEVLHAVRSWREQGKQCWFTIDAGPNVHILTAARDAAAIEAGLKSIGFAQDHVVRCPPGPGPELLREPVA
jgi:diphosphomevalonate decarboxylase